MGMSPSCHCICPGPGGAGSSPGADTVTDCSNCTVAARRYLITVPEPTADASYACCCVSYKGDFTVIHVAGTCGWDSAETLQCCKRDTGGNVCSTPPWTGSGIVPARYNYRITKSGLDYTYQLNMFYSGLLVEFPPFAVNYDYKVVFQTTTTSADCLLARTLPFFSHTRAATQMLTPCGGDLDDGGPCTQGWRVAGVSPYSGLSLDVEPIL